MPRPKFTPTLTDGNLERAEQSGLVNKHVVILGTAADGPMYTPVTIRDLDHAEQVFGAFGSGTLVQAANECWQAQAGTNKSPFITLMRVGDSVANRASLELNSSDIYDGTALKLEANNPGDAYNAISIVQDSSAKTFKLYNPKSGLWSTFKYDWDNPNNSSVHAHNLYELATAINADSNLRDVVTASVPTKTIKFELMLNTQDDPDIVVSSNSYETKLDISKVGTGDYVNDNLYLDGTDASNMDPSKYTTKPILTVNDIYSITDSGLEEFKAGNATVKATKLPLAGRSDNRFNTLLSVIPDNGTMLELATDPGGSNITSDGYFRVRNLIVGKFDTSNRSVSFKAEFAIADYSAANAGLVGPSKVAAAYHSAKSYASPYTVAKLGSGFPGITRWTAVGVEDATDNYPIKVEMRKATAGANEWDVMDLSKGTWTLSWNSSTEELTLAMPDDGATVSLAEYDGGDIRVSYDSCIGVFTEKSTLAAVRASSSFTDYFVRGKEIIFGSALPQTTVLRYATVNHYELGSTVVVTDPQNGKITISGEGIQPGPGGSAIGSSNAIIGFNYVYCPVAPALTSARTLNGGKNGINLTKAQLYDEFDDAFDALEGLNFGLMVLPGAYIDSQKTGYNANTGLAETVNAGFHEQVKTFLEKHNREAQCVMAFEPLVGTGPNSTITRSDIKTRAQKLTMVDYSDPYRAANFLQGFECKYIFAVDIEGYFRGKGARYRNTAEAAVAGHLAAINDEDTAYIKPIKGILSLRYKYSDKMTSGTPQLDALSDARINGATVTASGVSLVDGITLAATTSDYHLESTMRAVNSAVRDVRQVASAFLGKPNTIQTLQALDTAIRTRLSKRVPTSLVGFNFTIKSSPAQRVIGEVEIPLTLIPVFEIRTIKVPVILKSDISS